MARSARSATRTRRSRSCGPISTATGASSTRARRARSACRKVSVQTGTSHGGVPLPDGGVAEVKLDFEVLRELGEVARSYGAAGAVQHGASTLPDELFHRFPAVETAEIHLATGLPERALRASGLPGRAPPRDRGVVLRERGRRAQARPDRPAVRVHDPQEGDRPVQATSSGTSTTKDEILAAQRRKVAFLFTELGVNGSRDMVAAYIRPVEVHRPLPDALREAVAAG